MSKQGMFRRVMNIARAAMGLAVTRHYPDPVIDSLAPESRRPTRGRYRKPKIREAKRSAVPPCDPGTITYHDKLVKHFGARLALGYRECIRRGLMECLPTAQDFADNPPWAWRRQEGRS